jgi:hypothetical protein
MSETKALINFGNISKPATVLIEKISAAIGGLAKPWQITRVTTAEVAADKIRAAGQIEITELHQRAFCRFLTEEAKRQKNIETITEKALPSVQDDAKPDQINDDWISNFFDKCRLVSDDEMQKIWAKVLSGEANSPGKYSKRTVNLLASLDKSDAESFLKVCAFRMPINDGHPLIYDTESPLYESNGVTFPSVSHLESIGLVYFQPLAGFVMKEVLPGIAGDFSLHNLRM